MVTMTPKPKKANQSQSKSIKVNQMQTIETSPFLKPLLPFWLNGNQESKLKGNRMSENPNQTNEPVTGIVTQMNTGLVKPVSKQELAKLTGDIVNEARTEGGTGFIPSLRIKSKASDIPGTPGDWVWNNEQVIGPNVKICIGPWKMAARRFEGDNLAAYSYNRSKDSKWEFRQDLGILVWTYTTKTPVYLEILEKRKPDAGKACRNLVGFDILFWLPEINQWGSYFLASWSKRLTTVFEDCMQNMGRVANLGTKLGPGKNSYHIPTFALITGEVASFPKDAEKVFAEFLNDPIEVDSAQVER
jgi:hypothetical protein